MRFQEDFMTSSVSSKTCDASIDCRWLAFDAVGTLIYPDPPVAVAYHSFASRYGSRLSVNEVGDRFRNAFRRSETSVFPNGPQSGSPWLSSDEFEVARWRWIVEQVLPDVANIEECFVELWDHFARPSSWSLFDDVEMVLPALRNAGYRLAIASNFDSRLHNVCDGHAALKWIERCIVSSETGCRKPAPEFYSRLISQCDCLANQILMVGDDFAHDVAGPLAAGLQAILIDRKSNRSTDSIQSLEQLLNPRAV
jgi:putative hydrolase of the HAD superfamily